MSQESLTLEQLGVSQGSRPWVVSMQSCHGRGAGPSKWHEGQALIVKDLEDVMLNAVRDAQKPLVQGYGIKPEHGATSSARKEAAKAGPDQL